MTVTCLTHGPMLRREPLCWWECAGFDGEGCSTQIVYDEDLVRGADAGIPNVEVRP